MGNLSIAVLLSGLFAVPAQGMLVQNRTMAPLCYMNGNMEIERNCVFPDGSGYAICRCHNDSNLHVPFQEATECDGIAFIPAQALDCDTNSPVFPSAATATQIGTNTQTSTASQVSQEHEKKSQEKIEKVAEASSGGQGESRTAALRVSETGANHAATVGALFCAEGANEEIKKPGAGAEQAIDCRTSFSKAKALAEQGRKLGGEGKVAVDPDLAADSRSQEILEKFRQNFGVDPDEYLKKMIGSLGNNNTFAEMLSGRIPAQRLAGFFEEKEEVPGSERAPETLALLAKTASPVSSKGDSLRKYLRKSLSSGTEASAKPSTELPKGTNFGNLTPLESAFGSADSDGQGLNLFEVVHLRYQALLQGKRISSPARR